MNRHLSLILLSFIAYSSQAEVASTSKINNVNIQKPQLEADRPPKARLLPGCDTLEKSLEDVTKQLNETQAEIDNAQRKVAYWCTSGGNESECELYQAQLEAAQRRMDYLLLLLERIMRDIESCIRLVQVQ